MKQKVITYLETDRGFASGKQLYPTLPGKNLAFVNALNRMNNIPANCAKLHYEMAKTVGITERHLGIILRKPLKEVEVKEEKGIKNINSNPKPPAVIELDPNKVFGTHPKELAEFLKSKGVEFVFVPEFTKGLPGMAERKKFVEENNIEVTGRKAIDFDTAILQRSNIELAAAVQGYFKTETTQKFIDSPEKDKQSVKLFDQFPFLEEDDCLAVYKILTAELGISFRKYKAAHPHLFEQLTAEERLEAAKAVIVPYKENKAIWAELEHFQANRKPLGEHPLVKTHLREVEIKTMDTIPLTKLKTNLENSIRKHKKLLDELDGKKAKDKTQLINAKEEELYKVVSELKTRK